MAATHSTTHTAHEAHAHHEPGFWRKYVFSTDHKVIRIQYGITALLFLFFGFLLMAAMRWQIAYPGQPIPVAGKIIQWILGEEGKVMIPGGIMSPDLYNAFGEIGRASCRER